MVTGSKQRVVLHVGLPKTGTTYLQGLLAEQREDLRAGGVLYPFLRPGGMFHAAVEVRGSHAKFGLDPAEIAGSWAALCARAREHPGTTVISHEILGGADADEIAAALAPLDGLETHVVVTARAFPGPRISSIPRRLRSTRAASCAGSTSTTRGSRRRRRTRRTISARFSR